MSSRKEEERNEKIIRGLMKLPPNRRCINCNSLGPQYVCTNFWTFVCMTCSGIHREFTHRVKSVSMAKFTSQEVEALQKGGNQRARETFLNDWDPQRQRLPDNSNAEKVREFIKNVYVDRRYAGGKTSDKPPRDMQILGHHEEEARRASSYHSYSQSPPYDYQYEERRYGKLAPALTRKPGSDRGLYDGRISSFFSPNSCSEQMHDDRISNEGSNPRASDYSVSSTGDPFRPDVQSPNFQRDLGCSSPPYQTSRDILNEHIQRQTMSTFSDSNTKTDAYTVSRPQRTASLGSFGSFDSNSMSLKSVNSVSLVDVTSEPEQSAATHPDKQYDASCLPRSSVSGNFGGLDLFNAPFVRQTVTSSAPAIDLFQLPETQHPPSTPPVDLFQPSSTSSVPALHAHQSSQTFSSSLDLFSEMHQHRPASTLDKKSPDAVPKNQGWATFDLPQHLAPNLVVEDSTPAIVPPTDGGSLGKFDPILLPSISLLWPAFEDLSAHGPSSIPDLWHEGPNNVQLAHNAISTQSWNAFEDPTGHLPLRNIQQTSEEVIVHSPSTTVNQYFGEFDEDDIQRAGLDSGPPIPSVPLHGNGSSYAPSAIPSTVGAQSNATDSKSTNPFDLPHDSDIESSNMFLDMNSLQAALPCGQIPNSFLDGATQPWFPQNPDMPYIPSAQQGALGFMGGQAPTTEIPNVPTQGPVASVGGNPFA